MQMIKSKSDAPAPCFLPLEPLSSLGMWPNSKDYGGDGNNSGKHKGLSTDQTLFN